MYKRQDTIFVQTGETALLIGQEVLTFITFLGELSSAVWNAIRHPSRIRWKDTFYYMNVCGADGLPITMLICFLSGVIIGYQAAVQLQKYGAETFLPGLVGCTVVRELAPVMVAVIATGRAGSAFAAEIGTMKVSEEVDAMITMGIEPARFLVIPKLIAMITMLPMLTVFGDIAGILGGWAVGIFQLNMPLDVYYQTTVGWVKYKYFLESIFKSMIFAYVITTIGCWRGLRTGSGAVAVGKATTSTVVICILMIVVVDAILACFFNTIFFTR
ncbi:MAG: ABC transporter permease [Lentisphaeria bacterium]|nr:ABC transporter permease [Lentisphaeria bacterium]